MKNNRYKPDNVSCMVPEQIKAKIIELQKKHDDTGDGIDDVAFCEMYESEAEDLIIDYCESKGYQINGFPTDKRNIGGEEYDDYYFTRKRFWLYLDLLVVQKEDVADLMWFYNQTFWPETYSDKEHYLADIQHRLNTDRAYFYPDEL